MQNPFTSSLEKLGQPEEGAAASRSRSGSGSGGSGFGGGGWNPDRLSGDATFTFDSGGFDLSEWAELVKLKVRSNWIIPTAAYMGMKGISRVHLIIEKSGVITMSVSAGSSGVVSMDSAALNAVKASNPLPALPSGFPRDRLEAEFTFYYNIYPRD